MSTKTTFKRVALVAVASLGFGVLTSVAPAFAGNESANVDAISISAGVPRVGETVSITSVITENTAAFQASGDSVVLGAKFIADGGKPASSSASLTAGTVTVAQGQNVRLSGSADGTNYTTVTAYNSAYFTPDVAGSYKVMVWVESTADGVYTAGEKSTSLTLTTAGAPTSVVLTKESAGNPAITTGGLDTGALFSVVVKNAAGAQTELTSDESLSITSSISTTTFVKADGSTATTTLGSTDMHANGKYYFYALSTATAASTPTITVTASGGEIGSGVAIAATVAFKLPVLAATLSTISDGDATTTAGLAATLATDGFTVRPLTAITLIAVGDTATEVVGAEIQDTNGELSGLYGAVYTTTAATGASTTFLTSFSIGGANAQPGHTWIATIYEDSTTAALTATPTVAAAALTTISPTGIRVVKGSPVTFTGVVTDTYGLELAGSTVSWSVSGSNVVASTPKISDADGVVTFTYTPAISGSDTVAATNATSETVTVVDAITVGTVLLTTPHTSATTGVTEAVATYSDIDAGAAGASNTTYPVVATVKDANAVAISGVPVTFTISGTTAAVTSTTKTVYTGSTGTATAYVYGWAAGTYTVTATAGGKSDDAPINFAQTTDTEARSITATASGSIVTATVKDRYGNGVYNVPVYATRTGAGNFGGTSKTNGTTDRNGQIEFIVSGGAAEVTVSVGTSIDYGQTDATKGLVSSTTATDIFDPAVAGTAIADEEGVGVTFDAAGINSAKVTVEAEADTAQAAADAAAEATDAANAATDAANAAAEAADAATAAAQDAADAVAALSTQVSEMVNALKKQITALTNLVIKIQKKVKA